MCAAQASMAQSAIAHLIQRHIDVVAGADARSSVVVVGFRQARPVVPVVVAVHGEVENAKVGFVRSLNVIWKSAG